MFYVNLYQNNKRVVETPFESKEDAIKYFNTRIDAAKNIGWKNFDYIELLHEKCVLFDCEV